MPHGPANGGGAALVALQALQDAAEAAAFAAEDDDEGGYPDVEADAITKEEVLEAASEAQELADAILDATLSRPALKTKADDLVVSLRQIAGEEAAS